MLGTFPPALSMRLLNDPRSIAVWVSALPTTQQRSLTMSNKDEYFAMMESQIRKWDAEVDKLRAKSAQMSAEARIKYEEQLMAMRANRDAANKKLQEIRTASEAAWQNMQAGMDAAWASMKNALDKASSQFKK